MFSHYIDFSNLTFIASILQPHHRMTFGNAIFSKKIKGKENFPVFYLLSVKFGLFSKEKSLYPKVILRLCHLGPLYTVFYECNNVQGKNLNN